MSFRCPACQGARSLRITSSLELPPDSRSDEITLQLIKCSRCDFVGVAVYEESRRGALDDDSFHHFGYPVSQAHWDRLRELMERCPDPRNPRCSCPAHRRLATYNEWGRWNGLDAIPHGRPFELQFGA